MVSQDELSKRLKQAENLTGHCFADQELLKEALTHRSYANEVSRTILDNDRLEYLGDAVLDLVIAKEVFLRFPDQPAGHLTKLRASLVSEDSLADVARKHQLGEILLLGVGEAKTGGAMKDSVLSDSYEAMLGAVFLDGGLPAATLMVLQDFGTLIDTHNKKIGERDPKSLLQEVCAKAHGALPVYKKTGREGPDHDTLYLVECWVGNKKMGEGKGRNIKHAEQLAARMTLKSMKEI